MLMCWYIYDHNLSTLVVKIMVARFLLAKKHAPLVMILSLYIQNIQADICVDVPEGSCLVGEFFDADTGACKTCSFNRTSCGGGVSEDGCRCAGNGGFNGTVAEVIVVPQIKGTVECVDPSNCPGTYDGSGLIALQWLSSRFLLGIDHNTKKIYCFDTDVMPHTKTTFATVSDIAVDIVVDSDNNIAYAILCVGSATTSVKTCSNNGYLSAIFYNPASCTATSSHIVTESGTRKDFSKLATLVFLKNTGALLLMPITGAPVQEVTMNADRITIDATKEHSLQGLSLNYVFSAKLDPDGTSVWFFSSSAYEGIHKIDTTKTEWEDTKLSNVFLTAADHYPRSFAISPSGVMYAGGYYHVVQDNLDGTGEILAGIKTAGWGGAWGTLDNFVNVFGLAVSHDGAFVYTGSSSVPSLKRVATGLPVTTTVHAPKCSCVQDAVSSAGDLSGFCVGCPSENMTSPPEEDTCACKPEFFSSQITISIEEHEIYTIPWRTDQQIGYTFTLAGTPKVQGDAVTGDNNDGSTLLTYPYHVSVIPGKRWAAVSDRNNNKLKKFDLITNEITTLLTLENGVTGACGRGDTLFFIEQGVGIYQYNIKTEAISLFFAKTDFFAKCDVSKDGYILYQDGTKIYDQDTTNPSTIVEHVIGERAQSSVYSRDNNDFFYLTNQDDGLWKKSRTSGSTSQKIASGSPFSFPRGITISADGVFLYVCDKYGVKKIDSNNNWYVSTIAGQSTDVHGYADGNIDTAKFDVAYSIAIAPNDAILIVLDYYNHILRGVNLGRDMTITTIETRVENVCTSCPPHSSTRYASYRPYTENGTAEDCVCDAGYMQTGSHCSPCGIGFYSSGSLGASCHPCSVGTTAAPGAGKGPEDCRCDLLSSVVSTTGDFCTCPSDAFFVETQTVYDEIPNEHGPLGQTVTQYVFSDTNFVYYTNFNTALSQDGQFLYLKSYDGSEYTLARFNFASKQVQLLFYGDSAYTNFFLTNNDKYVWIEDSGEGLFQLDVETLVTGTYLNWRASPFPSHPAIVNRFIFPSSPRSWGNYGQNKWCVSGDGKLIALMWILDSPKRVAMEVRNSSNFNQVLSSAEKPLYTTYSLGTPGFFQFGQSNQWLYYGGFANINDETRDLRDGEFTSSKQSFFLYRVPVTLEGFADTSTRLVRTNDYFASDGVQFAAVSPDEQHVYFYGNGKDAIYRAPIQSPFADPIAERVTYGGDDNDIDGDATTAQFKYFQSLYVSQDQKHLIVLDSRVHKIKYVSTGPAFVPRSINHCRACPALSSTHFQTEQDVNLGGSVADCVCSNNLLLTETDTVVPVTTNAAGPAGQTTTPVATTSAGIEDIVIIPGQNKAFVKEETTDLHVLDLDTGDYSVAMSGLPHWSTGSVMCLSHDGSKVHAFNAYAASSSAAKWGYFTTQPPYEFVQDKNNLKAALNTQIYVADDGSQNNMIGRIKKCLEMIDGNLILLVDSSLEFLVHYNVESNAVTPLVSEKGPVKLDVYDGGDVFHLPGEGKFGFQVYDSGYHWYMYDLCTGTATLIFAPTSRYYAMVADATERFFYGVHYSYIDRINATSYKTTRLAGSSTYGNTDGTADEATFKDNDQVALSEDGQYLLIAQANEKMIRKVSLGAFGSTMQTLTQCVSKTCRAHASWREGISEVESLETNCVCDGGYVKTHGLCEFCHWTCESCPLHTYSNGSVGATCEPCPVGGTLAGVPAGSADECLCENLHPNFRLDNASGTCVCIESYTQGPILLLKNETTPDFFSTLPYQDDQRCYPCQPGLVYSNAFDHCVCDNSAEYPINATVQREDKEFVLGPAGTVHTFHGLSDFDPVYDDYYNPAFRQHPVVFEPGSSSVILGGHCQSSGDSLYRKNIFVETVQYETLLTDFTKIKDICVPPLHLWTEQQQNVVVLDHYTVYIVNLATLPLSKTNIGSTPNPANGCTMGDDGSIWVTDRGGRLLRWEYDGNNWQKKLDLDSYIYFNLVPDPVNGGFLTFQNGKRLVRILNNEVNEIWGECFAEGYYTLDYDADEQCPFGSIGPKREYDTRNAWVTMLHLALHPDHQYVYVSTSNVIRRLRIDDESYQLTTPFGPYTVQTNGAATMTRGTDDGMWNEARFNLITSIAISADGSTLVVMDDGNMRLISLGKTLDVPAAACVACPLHQFVPVAEQYAYTDFQTDDVCACRAGMQKITTPDTGTDIATGQTCAAGTYFVSGPDSLAYAGNPPASKWSHTGRQAADTWYYGQISCPAIDNENDSFGSVDGVPICFQRNGGSLTLELEAPSTVVGFNIIRVHSSCYVKGFSVLYSLDNVNWKETPCQKCTEYGCNTHSTTDHHCRYYDNNFEYPVIAKYVKIQTLHGVNDRHMNYASTCEDRHVVGTVDVRLDPCVNCPAPLTSLPNRQGLGSCFGDSCIACPAGKVSFEPSNLNTCYSCGVGKTANEERTACLCMNGYVTDGLTCTKCDEGTEGDFAGGCRACAPGSYSQHEWTWVDTTDAVPGSTKLCPMATRDCSYVETLSWAGADATQRHTQQITTGLGSMTVQTGALAAWADDESTTDDPIALFSSDPAKIFRLQYSVDGVAVGLNASLPGAWLVVTFEHPIQLHNYDLHALCDLASIACDHLTVHYYVKSKADTFWHPVHSGASIDMLAVRVTDVQATAVQTTSVTVDGSTVEITYLSIRMLNVAGLTQQTPPVCRPCGVTRFSSGAGAAACASCAPFAYSDTRNGQACDSVCFDGEEPAGASSCQACAAGQYSSVSVLYRPEQTQFPESVMGNASEVGRTEVTTGTGTYVLSYHSKNTGGLAWAGVMGAGAGSVPLMFKKDNSSDRLDCLDSAEAQTWDGLCGAWVQIQLPGLVIPESLQIEGARGIKEYQWAASTDGVTWEHFVRNQHDLSGFDAVRAYAFFAVVIQRCVTDAAGRCEIVRLGIHGRPKMANGTCVDCARGSFSSAERQRTCDECAAGTYQPGAGKTACLDCPPNAQSAAGSTALSACQCEAGYENTGITAPASAYCEACAAGFYKDATGVQACTACPALETTTATGKTSEDDCLCTRGHTFNSSDSVPSCAPCVPNTFKPNIGDHPCTACSANASSPAGAQESTACKCDFGFTGPDGGACAECAVGAYKNVSGASACQACPTSASTATSASSDLDDCLCTPGYTAATADGDTCAACAAGKYKLTLSDEACVSCPANTSTAAGASTGEDGCQCIAGMYFSEDAECVLCAADSFKPSVSNAPCSSCPPLSWTQNLAGSDSVDDCICAPTFAPETSHRVQLIASGGKYYTSGDTNFEHANPDLDMATNVSFVLAWPSGHPVVVSASPGHGAAPVSFAVRDDVAQTTTVTVPAAWSGGLYYYCLYHASMAGSLLPVHQVCAICPADHFCTGFLKDGAQEPTPCPAYMTSQPGSFHVGNCSCQAGYTWEEAGAESGCVPCSKGAYKDLAGNQPCTECPVHTYQDQIGATDRSQCQACMEHSETEERLGHESQRACMCVSGFYHSSASTCTACSPGTYNSLRNQTQCSNCSAGSSSNAYNATNITTCTLCGAGKYSREGANLCTPCNVNATSPSGSTRVQNCQCLPGFTGPDGGHCLSCARGQYKPGLGSAACTQCRAFSSTPARGSTNISECNCLAGYENTSSDLDPAGACSACSPGKYKPSFADEACFACPNNATSANASTALVACQCSPGFTGPDGGECSACAVTAYKDTVGAAPCKACPLNSTTASIASTAFAACQCHAGFGGADIDTHGCVACGIGAYKDEQSNAACRNCTQHTTTAGVGSTGESACVCTHGKFLSLVDGEGCVDCEAGRFKSQIGNQGCETCANHSSSPPGSTARTECICNAGFSGPDGGQCQGCEVGFYKSVPGTAPCTACPGNATTVAVASTGFGHCLCVPGYAGDGIAETGCRACATSTYKVSLSNTACKSCPLHKTTVSGAADDEAECLCVPGRSLSDNGTCSLCALGSFKAVIADASCETCPNGSSALALGAVDASMCNCSAGYEGSGGSTCSPCGAGSFKNVSGNDATCRSCPAGTYTTPDTQGLDDEDGCVSCPAGKTSNPLFNGNGISACIGSCGPGWTGMPFDPPTPDHPNGGCRRCEEGKYKPTFGADACTTCPTNSDSLESFSAGNWWGDVSPWSYCLCNVGFSMISGLTPVLDSDCVACFPGKYKNQVGSDSCSNCPPGTFNVNQASTSQLACQDCGVGKYNPVNGSASAEACLACRQGKYQEHMGQQSESACIPCGQGKYADSAELGISEDVCRECPAGTYSITTGNFDLSNCTTCVAGKYAETTQNTNESACIPCNPGTWSSTIGADEKQACHSCLRGTYQPLPAQTSAATCQPCPAGTRSAVLASGTAESCVPCDTGTYALASSSACTACSDNPATTGRVILYTGANSSAACESCKAGEMYHNDSHCAVCGAGTHSAAVDERAAGASCVDCTSGKFSAAVGASSPETCRDCAVGTYAAALAASSVCLACVPGKYQDQVGGASFQSCSNCPQNTYSGAFAANSSAACQDCPERYSSVEGSTSSAQCLLICGPGKTGPDGNCNDCEHGKYKSIFGSSACLTCPELASPEPLARACVCDDGYVVLHDDGVFNAEFPDWHVRREGGNSTATRCVACGAGTYSRHDTITRTTLCQDCPRASYSNATAQHDIAVCTQCPEGKSSLAGSTTPDDCADVCGLGLTGPFENCLACPEYTFKTVRGAQACMACDPTANAAHVFLGRRTRCVCGAGFAVVNTSLALDHTITVLNHTLLDFDFDASQPLLTGQTHLFIIDSAYLLRFSHAVSDVDVQNYTHATDDLRLETPHHIYSLFAAPGAVGPVQIYVEDAASARRGPVKTTSLGAQAGPSNAVCEACAIGKYKSVHVNVPCVDCPEGTRAVDNDEDRSYASTCQVCPVGKYQNTPGQLSCAMCLPGTYGTPSADSVDEACAGGWCNLDPHGAGACACSNASVVVPVSTADECRRECDSVQHDCFSYRFAHGTCCLGAQPAAAGNGTAGATCFKRGVVHRTLPTEACTPCPVGTYALYENDHTSPAQCTRCPAGTYSETLGASSSSVCLACPAGKFSAATGTSGAESCLECSAGTFSVTVGATNAGTCSRCTNGKYSSARGANSSATCQDCSAGKYSPLTGATNASNCQACPAGKYSEVLGAFSENQCLLCAPAKFSDAHGLASPCSGECPPGTFSAESGLVAASQCSNCSVGEFQDQPGQTSCAACTPGTFALQNRTAVCSSCEPGYQCPHVDHPPEACPKGASSLPNAVACFNCTAGEYADVEGSRACFDCPAGFSCASTDDTPEVCSQGTHAPARSIECSKCRAGFHGVRLGAQCADGWCLSTAGCTGVVHSSSSGHSVRECTDECNRHVACAAVAFDNATHTCTFLANVTETETSTPNATACWFRGAAVRSSHNVSCVACARGTASAVQGMTERTGCAACDAGLYNPHVNATACLACPPGRYGSSTGARLPMEQSCALCNRGTYANASAQSACTACPRQTYGLEAGAAHASDCSRCSSNMYSNAVGATNNTCKFCASNRYLVLNASTQIGHCHPCPAEQVADMGSVGVQACSCREGLVKNATTEACTPCQSNFFCPGSNQQVACPSNTASPAASAFPTNCSCKDSFVPADDGCQRCAVGQFVPAGESRCSYCPSGSYCPDGVTAVPCPDYATSLPGASVRGVLPDAAPGVHGCACKDGYLGNLSNSSSVCTACSRPEFCSQPPQAASLQVSIVEDIFTAFSAEEIDALAQRAWEQLSGNTTGADSVQIEYASEYSTDFALEPTQVLFTPEVLTEMADIVVQQTQQLLKQSNPEFFLEFTSEVVLSGGVGLAGCTGPTGALQRAQVRGDIRGVVLAALTLSPFAATCACEHGVGPAACGGCLPVLVDITESPQRAYDFKVVVSMPVQDFVAANGDWVPEYDNWLEHALGTIRLSDYCTSSLDIVLRVENGAIQNCEKSGECYDPDIQRILQYDITQAPSCRQCYNDTGCASASYSMCAIDTHTHDSAQRRLLADHQTCFLLTYQTADSANVSVFKFLRERASAQWGVLASSEEERLQCEGTGSCLCETGNPVPDGEQHINLAVSSFSRSKTKKPYRLTFPFALVEDMNGTSTRDVVGTMQFELTEVLRSKGMPVAEPGVNFLGSRIDFAYEGLLSELLEENAERRENATAFLSDMGLTAVVSSFSVSQGSSVTCLPADHKEIVLVNGASQCRCNEMSVEDPTDSSAPCIPCAPGLRASTDRTTCIACKPSFYCHGGANMHACPAGTRAAPGAAHVGDCVPNSFDALSFALRVQTASAMVAPPRVTWNNSDPISLIESAVHSSAAGLVDAHVAEHGFLYAFGASPPVHALTAPALAAQLNVDPEHVNVSFAGDNVHVALDLFVQPKWVKDAILLVATDGTGASVQAVTLLHLEVSLHAVVQNLTRIDRLLTGPLPDLFDALFETSGSSVAFGAMTLQPRVPRPCPTSRVAVGENCECEHPLVPSAPGDTAPCIPCAEGRYRTTEDAQTCHLCPANHECASGDAAAPTPCSSIVTGMVSTPGNRCRCPSAHLLQNGQCVSCNVSVDNGCHDYQTSTHVCLAYTHYPSADLVNNTLATLAAVADEYQHDYNASYSALSGTSVHPFASFALGLTTETVNSALQRPAQAPLTLEVSARLVFVYEIHSTQDLKPLFVEGLVYKYNVDVLIFTPEKVVVERIASLHSIQFRASVSFELAAGVDVNALFNAQVQNAGVVFLDGAPQRVMLKHVHSTGALHVQVHTPDFVPLPRLDAALLFASAPAPPTSSARVQQCLRTFVLLDTALFAHLDSTVLPGAINNTESKSTACEYGRDHLGHCVCPQGFVPGPVAGAIVSCVACAPGLYSDFGQTCAPCSDNMYCSGGAMQHPCPENSFTAGLATAATDCLCLPSYARVSEQSCRSCAQWASLQNHPQCLNPIVVKIRVFTEVLGYAAVFGASDDASSSFHAELWTRFQESYNSTVQAIAATTAADIPAQDIDIFVQYDVELTLDPVAPANARRLLASSVDAPAHTPCAVHSVQQVSQHALATCSFDNHRNTRESLLAYLQQQVFASGPWSVALESTAGFGYHMQATRQLSDTDDLLAWKTDIVTNLLAHGELDACAHSVLVQERVVNQYLAKSRCSYARMCANRTLPDGMSQSACSIQRVGFVASLTATETARVLPFVEGMNSHDFATNNSDFVQLGLGATAVVGKHVPACDDIITGSFLSGDTCRCHNSFFIQQENDHKSCTICLPHHHCNGTHAAPCEFAVSDMGQTGWSSPADCMCPPGRYMDKEDMTCRLCESGVYCTGGYADKAACPAATPASSAGAVSAAQCFALGTNGALRVSAMLDGPDVSLLPFASKSFTNAVSRQFQAESAWVQQMHQPATISFQVTKGQWRTQTLSAFQGQVARGVQSDTVAVHVLDVVVRYVLRDTHFSEAEYLAVLQQLAIEPDLPLAACDSTCWPRVFNQHRLNNSVVDLQSIAHSPEHADTYIDVMLNMTTHASVDSFEGEWPNVRDMLRNMLTCSLPTMLNCVHINPDATQTTTGKLSIVAVVDEPVVTTTTLNTNEGALSDFVKTYRRAHSDTELTVDVVSVYDVEILCVEKAQLIDYECTCPKDFECRGGLDKKFGCSHNGKRSCKPKPKRVALRVVDRGDYWILYATFYLLYLIAVSVMFVYNTCIRKL